MEATLLQKATFWTATFFFARFTDGGQLAERLAMNAADFEKLSDAEKEHFYQCSKCGEYVDKRELREVIFHETDHKRKPHIPRIVGKPIRNRLSRR
jgi:hypothetical protein